MGDIPAHFRYKCLVAEAKNLSVIVLVIKGNFTILKFIHLVSFQLRHQLAQIRLRALWIDIQHLLAILVGIAPIAVLQEDESSFQQGCSIGGGLLHHHSFLGGGFVALRQLPDTADQILHKAEFRHILRLQMREFLRQIVGIHITVGGDQHLFRAATDQRQITAPLVFYPHGVEVFRLRAQHHHDLGTVQRGKYVRLVGDTQLVLQCDAGEEHLEALLCQLVVEIGSQYTIRCAAAVGVRLLIADEHVERLFFLGNLQNALLNFVDCFSLGLVDHPLGGVGVLDGGLVVLIIENGGVLGAVHRRHALVGGRILHVLNTVAAQHQRPIGLGVGLVLVEDLLIDAHCLVEIVVSTEMVGAVVQVGAPVVVQLRQRLCRAAVFAHGYGFTGIDVQLSAAHFAFEDGHFSFSPSITYSACTVGFVPSGWRRRGGRGRRHCSNRHR